MGKKKEKNNQKRICQLTDWEKDYKDIYVNKQEQGHKLLITET